MVAIQVPCGKCIECRLEYAREWAVRGQHESLCYKDSIFLTLTFDEKNIGDNKLNYHEFQLFMERLNYETKTRPAFMVSGEYGDRTGRKHYHVIIFGYRPTDAYPIRRTPDDHLVYRSPTIEKIWKHGLTEFGSVTFESISYIARYCLKKRGNPETDPLFKTSRFKAIGKSWLEKNFEDIFNTGICITRDGFFTKIPRYYEKWFNKNHPEKYRHYIQNVKHKKITQAEKDLKNQEIQHQIEVAARNVQWNYKNENQRRALINRLKQAEIKRKLD